MEVIFGFLKYNFKKIYGASLVFILEVLLFELILWGNQKRYLKDFGISCFYFHAVDQKL